MTALFDTLTFDCYGTLIDWRGGIVDAFRRIAHAAGRGVDETRILDLHARIEPQIQAGEYRSYREVLDRTAVKIAAEIGIEIPAAETDFLSRSLSHWRPFPDTVAALERLVAAGARLGILSNVDDDLLDATLVRLKVPFDLTVTAQQVRSYKPAPGHFEEAGRRVGRSRWLHVAQSLFHDFEPAAAIGLPVVWINRLGEPLASDARPLASFPDMASFATAFAEDPRFATS